MKRTSENIQDLVKHVNIIMLDIEGTTTSISFVKDELFPYVLREAEGYLESTWQTEETQKDVAALRHQIKQDVDVGLEGMEAVPEGGKEKVIPVLVANVKAMIAKDRKVRALKTLQGHMWRRAYHQGDIKGHVYDDVVEALAAWKAAGKKLVIYSSGSVEAQKLLFSHSTCGDLLHYFSDHFDTEVGMKVESESYREILRRLRSPPPESVLFVTDLAKEARAASEAGLRVVLSEREGTAPLTAKDREAFPCVTSLTALIPDSSPTAAKRPRAEEQREEGTEEKTEEGIGSKKN